MIDMKLIELCVAALLCVSCSIKEDRTECPCLLEFDFSKCQSLSGKVNISCVNTDVTVFETFVFPKDYRLSKLVAKVPKGDVDVAAWWGPESSHVSGDRLIVPLGCQGDSLYVHSASVNCNGETAADTLQIFKQFASVHVIVSGEGTGHIEMLVHGNVNGYDMMMHRPLNGDFEYLVGEDSWDFRLPRQTDSSLTFELLYDGLSFGVLPVGEWIVQSGYSWEDENLDDIMIEIDYGRYELRVKVDDWECGMDFKVEI